jgi:hypothetical protein
MVQNMKDIQFFPILLSFSCAATGIPEPPYTPPERPIYPTGSSDFDPTAGSTQYPGTPVSETENTTTETDTGINDTGSPSSSLDISSGHWTYTTGAETYNSCPNMDGSSTQPTDSAGFQVQIPTPGSIILTPDGSTESISCQLEQDQYSCIPTTSDSSFSFEGLNVSIRTTTNLVIEPNDSNNAVFNYSLLFTCLDIEIFGCSVTQDLPCNVEFYAGAVLD